MDAFVAAGGLRRVAERKTWFLRIVVYERPTDQTLRAG
jgi:hypothetical protein